MISITLRSEEQPDGSIHHVPGHYCSDGPCCKVLKEGCTPDPCPFLHAGTVNDEGALSLMCNKPCDE